MAEVEVQSLEAATDRIVEGYGSDRTYLIHVLQDLQEEFDYLPKPVLKRVAERLEVPLAEVLRVATFYAAFSLEPRGEHVITVCMGTACHVRGARAVLERLQETLKVQAGRTTEDGKFTLETVNCLGACALGPLISVDGQYHGKMTPGKVQSVLKEFGVDAHGNED
jgi:NADH-quinone oxidoreductase subunit E